MTPKNSSLTLCSPSVSLSPSSPMRVRGAGEDRHHQDLQDVAAGERPTGGVGIRSIRNFTTVVSCARVAYSATSFGPRVAGSMLKPAPGRTSSPTTRPRTSAKVETTSKQSRVFSANTPEGLQVAHLGDANSHRGENHRRDQYLDQLHEGVAEGFEALASAARSRRRRCRARCRSAPG